MQRVFIFTMFVLIVLISANADAIEYSSFAKASMKTGHEKALAMKHENVRFWLFIPKNYGKAQDSWPLLVYLHGASHRGHDLNQMKSNVPIEYMRQNEQLPFIVAAPQCPSDKRWSPAALNSLIDKLIQELAIDVDRVYVTGMSLGAFGTWELAAAYPEKLAAIAPVSGGGKDEFVPNLKNIAIWAFHGLYDRIVSPHRSRNLVNAIQKEGGDAKLTEYKARHDIWVRVYRNSDIYNWLLEQERASSSITYRNDVVESQLQDLLLKLDEEKRE